MSEINKAEETTEVETAPMGVGQVARRLIARAYKEGAPVTNEQLAILICKLFKEQGLNVKTSAASIAWYKNDMRKKGQLPSGATRSAKSIELDLDNIELV